MLKILQQENLKKILEPIQRLNNAKFTIDCNIKVNYQAANSSLSYEIYSSQLGKFAQYVEKRLALFEEAGIEAKFEKHGDHLLLRLRNLPNEIKTVLAEHYLKTLA